MKKSLLVANPKLLAFILISPLLFFAKFAYSQTVLQPGEVFVTGYYGDGAAGAVNCNEAFSFVSFVPLSAGTEIRFSEEDYADWGTGSEGDLVWTNNTGATIPALTNIIITTHSESAPICGILSASIGIATFELGPVGGFPSTWSLGMSNEEIIIFQGPGPRTLGTAISLFLTDNPADATNTPPTLLAGGAPYIINFEGIDDDADVAVYTGPLSFSSFNDFVAQLTNEPTNWTTQDGAGDNGADGTFPDVPANLPVFPAACSDPDIPSISSAPGTICDGNSALLTISGDKNDATQWVVYTGGCGGTQVATTAGSTVIITPTPPGTTYYVRGEGGCVTPGSCGTVFVNTTAREDATFSYSAASYCVNDVDPTPTISGVPGGSFTSSPGGLSLNPGNGSIDVSISTPGTYTVTYSTSGLCAGDEDVTVTINALDDASFTYSAAAYCADDTDPTPTITGLGGGTFSAGAGLNLNASTGTVDVSSSTPGTYTITYTTTGACPNSSSITMTINVLDDASFSYSAASYCIADADPTPTITGLAGGAFTAGAGLVINAATGSIDLSASTPGTYTVNYTTTGTCPNSSNVSVTVTALDDASFSYSAAAYCTDDTDPTPTITGVAGGTFSSLAGLSINAGTGNIDVSASTPGTYTITYTTTGACSNSSNVAVTINALDDASFSYSAASYCANGTDPTPTITGLAGGTFSAGAGLSINAATGSIDLSASTPGAYSVTYTSAGSCPNSSSIAVSITSLDDASFVYTGTPSVTTETYTFTSATATGNVGPTQVLCDAEYFGTNLAGNVSVTGGIQTWVVPVTGTYTIEAFGGQGYGTFGGRGAYMSGEFNLTAGTTLKILVGQEAGPYFDFPNTAYNHQYGGGGGSFVTDVANAPFIVAGGGGGSHATSGFLAQCDGQITASGAAGFNASLIGAGGNGGNGGSDAISADGGGGLLTNGAGIAGGIAFVNGGLGGIDEGTGGFGCGGGTSSWNNYRGGGGGGYSGGGGANNSGLCCPSGGGGGSFNLGANQSNLAGVQLGNGKVIISLSTPTGGVDFCANDTDPTPTITGVAGGTFTSAAGVSLNAASGVIDLSASTTGTYPITYTTTGACANSSIFSVTVQPLDDASFSYSAAAYCADDTDPTPTITGLGGGTFSAGAGLSLNASTGTVDVSISTPGTYTITYTSAGACPNSSSISMTINASDDASFSYSAAAYCVNDADPTPSITGLAGGTFTAGAGLNLNASTGTIDVSSSTPGTYTVTYTTAGTCPNASSVTVTINALDDASFTYSAAAYCADDTDPTPTITGLGGGTFSAGAGLSLNASTGTIDVSSSTPGTYTVTYTTAGACPNTSSVTVTINALDDASFSYSAASYCIADADPTPTITGLAGGTFSAGAGLSINAAAGSIDVSSSTPGTYTVTYTTAGTCPNSSNVSVTVTALDDASFSYSAAAYCADDTDPIPTITGVAGGTFSSLAGLSINAGTGIIDVSASTPGTYTITYTTTGACSNSSNVAVTINALDDASFSYSAASYCANGTDPTPTITGLAGGTFSAGAGLSINAGTGNIDVSASTPGTYTVSYTTTGACPNASSVSVTINAADDASFSYSTGAFCADDLDPIPTITGLLGGTFSAGAGLSINASSGVIDLSASAVGAYTVTYTTAGACPDSSTFNITINPLPSLNFTALPDLCLDAGIQLQIDPGFAKTLLAVYPFGNSAVDPGLRVVDPITFAETNALVLTLPGKNITGANGISRNPLTSVVYAVVKIQGQSGRSLVTVNELTGETVEIGNTGINIAGISFTNAGVLYAVSGDGASPSETLYTLDLNTGTPTIVMALGNGDDGEAIAFNYDDGYLYHMSGLGTANVDEIFERIDLTTLSIIPITLSGYDASEVFGMSYAGNGEFIISNISSEWISVSDTGLVSLLANGTQDMRGHALGQLSTVVYSGPGVTDDANGTTYTFDPATAGVGVHTITATATNAQGCTNTFTDDVEVFALPVVTLTPPTGPICPNDVLTNQGGGLPVGGVYSGSGVTDDANGMTYTFDASVSGTGTHTITYTYTDLTTTCTDSASVIVSVGANTPPTAACQNISIYLDGAGNASIVAADIDGGSFDNCGPITLSAGQTMFTCANLGPNNVTLTVTDVNANVDSCVAVVTVIDTIAPSVLCTSGTQNISDDGTGDCTFTPFAVGQAGSYSFSDNCNDPITVQEVFTGALNTTATFTLSPGGGYTPVQAFPVGITNVTVIVTDASGNVDSCTHTTTILDDEDPFAVCQNINVYLDGAGTASIVAADIDNGSVDSCSAVALGASQTAFTCADLGANNVTLTVTDGSTNTASCVAVVTVLDTITPTITCPGNQTESVNAFCNFVVIDYSSLATTADNCGTPTISQSPAIGSVVSVNTTVTLTVDDGNGNSTQCNFDIILNDTTPPMAVCQNINAYLDGLGNASIVAADIDGGSSDNCGTVTLSASQTAFTCTDIGANSVTLTVTDGSSNVTNCVALVTVLDTITPTITCPGNQTENLSATCDFTLVDYTSLATVADNCNTSPLVTQSPAIGTVVTANTTVTLTVDDGNGNTAQCTFDVILDDVTPPMAVCQNMNVYLDGSGNASIAAADIDGGSSDNCGAVTLAASQTAFTCTNLGANNVTLTVTDASTNSSNCVAVVTVLDTITPTITCPGNQTENLSATCDFTLVDYTGMATVADNCNTSPLVTQSPAIGTVLTANTTITLTVDDGNGNTAQCAFDVILTDVTPPTAVCQNVSVYLDGAGNASIVDADIDGGSSDNCGAVTISASQTNFTCADVGANNITLTVTDASTNVSSCVAVVTVLDTITPVLTSCPGSQTEFFNASCAYILPNYAALATATDNCQSSVVISQSPSAGSAITSNTTVVLTADDGSGNIDQCSFDVFVSDTTAPITVCQNVTLFLDASGTVAITSADIDGGSVDNCTGILLVASQTVFTCNDLGANNVTLTATDFNGLSSSCVAVVTVVDTISPVITCPGNLTEIPNVSCQFTIPDYSLNAGFNATDNCTSPPTITQVPAIGTVIGFGVQTITLTADDGNGNTATCSFDIDVVPSNITANLTLVECAGFSTTINGNVYNTSGVYTDVLVGAAANGCDSTLTTDLTILPALESTLNLDICTGESIVINGTVYNELNLTGTEVFTNVGPNNCDSTVTVNLTLFSVDYSLTASGITLTANQAGASYQWLDCDNGNAVIPGETNQSFTATTSGFYAVQITSGICVGTSTCESIIVTGIRNIEELEVNIYPNPTQGVVMVQLDQNYADAQLTVYNAVGRMILNQNIVNSSSATLDLSNYAAGVYLIRIESGDKQVTKRILKE